MDEKWIRDPISAILWGMAILFIGIYVAIAAAGVIPWDHWWSYILIAIGLALGLELPIRIINGRYRLHGLIFTRVIIGGGLVSVGIGGIVGYDGVWLAGSIIALGCAIWIFGLWYWLVPRRQGKTRGSRKSNIPR
jgi:hypothetical protein